MVDSEARGAADAMARMLQDGATTSAGTIESDESSLDLRRFPARNPGLESRRVYFDAIDDIDRQALAARGYEAICLLELARGSPAEETDYLLAKAQAVEEGTAFATKLTAAVLELEMKANKMLNDRTPNVRVNLNVGKQDVKALLASWGSSRHTLRGNTTIQEAQVSTKEGPAKRGRKKKREK